LKTLLSIALILSSLFVKAGYDFTPVMIHLNKEKQADSVGFNLVEELPRLLYKKLLEGEIKLYNNPAKEIEITPSNLIKLEQDNQVRFDAVPDLFINELWSKLGRRFEFKILGFSFFSRKSDQSLMNFGFIDIVDVKDILIQNLIPTNANGSSELSFWQALNSKAYPFQIVKFGGRDLVKKPELAIKLKKQALCKKVQSNSIPIAKKKRIWSILYPSKEEQIDNRLICRSLETYYRRNKQEVFEFINLPDIHIQKEYPITITEIELEEIWNWDEDEVKRDIIRIRPYVNGVPLAFIGWEELKNKNILLDFRAITDLLEDHNYTTNIIKINDEVIAKIDQAKAQNQLMSGNFNKILFKN